MKKFLIFSICLASSFICFMNKASASTNHFSNIDYNAISIDYEQQVAEGWLPYASSLNTTNSGNYTIYLKSSDKSVIGYKRSGASHILDNMYVISWPTATGFEYNNVAFITYAGSSDTDTLILSKGSLPTLGGDCETGSFCYNIVNSGSQGNGRSAYFNSETIILSTIGFVDPTFYSFGYPHRLYYNGISQQRDVGTGTYVTYNSTSTFYSTEPLYNNGNYSPPNNEIVPLPSAEPEAEYTISDGSEIGKKIEFSFSNFDTDSYATITNLSSGEVINVSDLSVHTSYIIDNISYDSVYYVEVYNNDELVFVDTIDINQEVRLYNKPYIDLTLDKERLISWLDFYNLKENYHVYYSKNNGSFTEVQLESGNNHIRVGFNNEQQELHNKNYTIRGQITDENGNILYDRGYNIVFFKNQPYFTFNSSYSIETGCNNLTITYHNSQNSDTVSYSYDNVSYSNFTSIKSNKLEVCASTPVYVKATRGNDNYYGYFYVNIEEFSSSSNEQYQQNSDLLSAFTNLFGNQDSSILENFSIFFNALKRSFIYKYLLLMILGAFILLIMKLLRR